MLVIFNCLTAYCLLLCSDMQTEAWSVPACKLALSLEEDVESCDTAVCCFGNYGVTPPSQEFYTHI